VDTVQRTVRLAMGAVGPTILRARATEAWVGGEVPWDGGRLDDAVVAEFGRRAATEARPIDDHRSPARYRHHAMAVLASRLLRRAFPHE
jgi:CO/xanthine dehydrogenase FAD-binding subunit